MRNTSFFTHNTLKKVRKAVWLFFLIFYAAGCTTAAKSPGIPAPVASASDQHVQRPALTTLQEPEEEKDPIVEEKVVEPAVEAEPVLTGTIFAKTYFEGVVKASYVRLSIVDQADEKRNYELVIGDKARQMNFPWKVQTVKPGYFFIELPAGHYKFQSVSIPVGTTVAMEPMDIGFEVRADKAVYLGKLEVLGTKEKIKLGGVPVIKPGFEYRVNIIDETLEAFQEYRARFPDSQIDVEVRLMHINRAGKAEPAKPEQTEQTEQPKPEEPEE